MKNYLNVLKIAILIAINVLLKFTAKERLIEIIRIRKIALEGHILGTDMKCTRCGVSMVSLDAFKCANQLKLITCDQIQLLQQIEAYKHRKIVKKIKFIFPNEGGPLNE